MLSYFQVNQGCYLRLEQELSPTARVAELCSCVERVSGEHADSQVLLTCNGKQMDPQDLIGKYSVGTDEKPIYVFYRSYLGMTEPPAMRTRTPQKGQRLQKQLEILRQKPSASLFHHQISLAKQLSEFSLEVGGLCGQLAMEYNLQFGGWQTALSNCSDIVGLFKKHQHLFSKAVEQFRSVKPQYLELLQQFPEQVTLLQKLPLPSSLQKSTSSSLYDWISTHDEKNSLMDLNNECRKALEKIDGDQLDNTLQMSTDVSGMCSEVVESTDKTFKTEVLKMTSFAEEAKEILTTVSALNQNIQSTSDKALRAGDAKTIAILVDSHHKSLQLISTHCSRLETISASLESSKADLTAYVHRRLKQLMEMQRKVKESNDQLRILHEQVKLARQRFQILQQVSSTPQVLVDVFGELGRRRSYSMALEKVMSETSSRLQKARGEEKELRKRFDSSHGSHFVTSLFPELQDRVPDVSFHAPKSSLSKSHEASLESLCAELPKDMRPSFQLDTSTHTLLQAFASNTSGSRAHTLSDPTLPNTDLKHTVSSPNSRSSTLGPLSPLQSSSETPASSSTEAEGRTVDMEELKEVVGKLELNNVSLTSKLQKQLQVKTTLEASMVESESVCTDLSEKLRQSEGTVASLKEKLAKMEAEKEAGVASMKDVRRANLELAEKLTQVGEEKQRVVQGSVKVNEESNDLRAIRDKLLAEVEEFKHKLAQTEVDKEQLSLDLERLANGGQELKSAVDGMRIIIDGLEDKLAKTTEEKLKLVQDSEEVCKERSELKTEKDKLLIELNDVKEKLKDTDRKYVQVVEKLKKDYSLLEEDLGLRKSQHLQDSKELERVMNEKQQLSAVAESLVTDKNALNTELSDLRRKWSLEREQVKDELARSVEESKVLQETLKGRPDNSGELVSVKAELKEKEDTYTQSKLENQEALRVLESSRSEVTKLKEELLREQHRFTQAQNTLKSTKTQLDSVAAKRQELSLKQDERNLEKQELTLQVERTRQALSDKNSELVAMRSRFEAEVREMDVKKEAEKKKCCEAATKARKLENSLNQREAEVNNYKEKFVVAEKKIEELEMEVADKKEHILATLGKGVQANEVAHLRTEVQEKNERIRCLRVEFQRAQRELEESQREWFLERDQHLMRTMELERDLKELRRTQGGGGEDSPKKMVLQRGSSSSGMGSSMVMSSSSYSSADLVGGVTIQSIQVGHVALFMCDAHGNYLALSVDTKTYYLNADCVPKLTDVAPRMPRIQLKRKLLIGRITGRMYMEVRKENNRLKVPVGSRLYKVEAECIPL